MPSDETPSASGASDGQVRRWLQGRPGVVLFGVLAGGSYLAQVLVGIDKLAGWWFWVLAAVGTVSAAALVMVQARRAKRERTLRKVAEELAERRTQEERMRIEDAIIPVSHRLSELVATQDKDARPRAQGQMSQLIVDTTATLLRDVRARACFFELRACLMW
jgi:hypothetical protein